MGQGRSRGGSRAGIAALGGALVLGLALAPPAAAQEAPICLKAAEKLSDKKDVWNGKNGKDSVTGLRGNDKLNGRGGNDFINGSRDSDVVKGGPGNDLLCGGRGHDVLIGGPGNDKIYGEEENDTIIPGPGNDYALGSAGDDKIEGWGKGGDGTDGIDILDGGFNNDQIEAGGADTLLGYTHDDVLSTKTPDIAPAVMDGGGNNDVLYGSEVADQMRGGERLSGDDKLFGNGGNDQMRGDGNDDELSGQGGDDNLMGDDGFDTLDGGDGDDTCDGGDLEDTATNCEHQIAIEHGARKLFGAAPGRLR
jgi:Ca2+-binding RTX toxin-like protein